VLFYDDKGVPDADLTKPKKYPCRGVSSLAERKAGPSKDEWKSTQHALAYLARADRIPHRTEGERVLLDHVPLDARRILDLGTGDGRLLALLRVDRPRFEGVAVDFSETMLDAARRRFAADKRIKVVRHDLNLRLPLSPGEFDAVVSSFAIHHCPHDRKRALYGEIFGHLAPGGVFCNLEHVASPTTALHRKFLSALGSTPEAEDRSNKLLDVETQVGWLRDIGFGDVDCYWKWLELALLIGLRPEK
jgi:tRNA (cmo5U34)-methyltransferase